MRTAAITVPINMRRVICGASRGARPRPRLRAGIIVAACVSLVISGGCAHRPTEERAWPGDLPARVELAEVPFFPQDEYQCGPATLATALVWSGAAATPEQLAPAVYVPKRRGSLQAELIAGARRFARVPYVLRPDFESLLREVAAGHPVIVLQNLGLAWYERWHYAVVVGFDRDDDTVILRSGREERRVMSRSLFLRTWERGDRWALAVLPPTRVPATADELRYLEAVMPLERAGEHGPAQRAYTAAYERWPTSLGALLGMGNTAYALGDKRQAEAHYREATRAHPHAGIAFNNLAQVLAERGALKEARTAIARAVQLGGPLAVQFLQTRKEIERLSTDAR